MHFPQKHSSGASKIVKNFTFIHSPTVIAFILVGVMGTRKLSQKRWVKGIPGGMPIHHRATHTAQSHLLPLLGRGRKPETHTNTGRICETLDRPWKCVVITLHSASSQCSPGCLAENKLFSSFTYCNLLQYQYCKGQYFVN